MRVLLVEDDPMLGHAVVQALRDASYAVDWLRDGQSAAAALALFLCGVLVDRAHLGRLARR